MADDDLVRLFLDSPEFVEQTGCYYIVEQDGHVSVGGDYADALRRLQEHGEELDLTPEDEAILLEAWQELGAKERAKKESQRRGEH